MPAAAGIVYQGGEPAYTYARRDNVNEVYSRSEQGKVRQFFFKVHKTVESAQRKSDYKEPAALQ
jgi:hypothetical protein